MADQDWTELLLAFLHDPPDKALGIPGHEARAADYAGAALGGPVTQSEIHGGGRSEDQQASIAERLPTPKPGEDARWAVGVENGRLEVRHPLSGQAIFLSNCILDEDLVRQTIREMAGGIEDPTVRFLALWRLLPEKLADHNPTLARLPADTRIPDHTIWHHLDTTAALHPAYQNVDNAAFLSFSLGPVQPFIAAARSVRDLWSGSAILSWLTFQAMVPIIEKYGPTALIYPYLRGTPLMDMWLRRVKDGLLTESIPKSTSEARKAPCIPNRFLAVVPYGREGTDAKDIAQACEDACREKWDELTEAVRCKVGKELKAVFETSARGIEKLEDGWPKTWAKRWKKQVDSFFDIRTAVLPWRESWEKDIARLFGRDGLAFEDVFRDVAPVRGLADAIPPKDRPGYDQKHAGRWQARLDLSARAMDAQRAVRHIPPYLYLRCEKLANGHIHQFPPKCTLWGTYEQMGPEGLAESREFWDEAAKAVNLHGVRLRKRERFCALAVAKRFAAPAFLVEQLGLTMDDLSYYDTATVAAQQWLKEAHLQPRDFQRWSGNWLHWPHPKMDDPDVENPQEDVWEAIQAAKARMKDKGLPPAYYAVVQMDADQMGGWLRGEKTPKVRDVYHPRLLEYFEQPHIWPNAQRGLNAKRPVGPALHAAISEALTNFAVHIVPGIVQKHDGTLIYAGGDDLLALLPARSALPCAQELYQAFRGDSTVNNGADQGYYRQNGRDLLVMGPKATLSAGIAVAHYKSDLREALQSAREAEKAAKNAGRDALQLAICRRSGEHFSALCPWSFLDTLTQWLEGFLNKASDRWAYHLASEMDTLQALSWEAICAEVKRLFARAELATRCALTGTKEEKEATVKLGQWLDKYRDAVVNAHRRFSDAQALQHFVRLVQSASFLTRGRDE